MREKKIIFRSGRTRGFSPPLNHEELHSQREIDSRFALLEMALRFLRYQTGSTGIEMYMWKQCGSVLKQYTFCDNGDIDFEQWSDA